MAGALICYSHITPRLVRRIQCLAERVPGLVALEVAGSDAVYPWWQGRYEVGEIRQVQLFSNRMEDLSQSEIVRAGISFLDQQRPQVAIMHGYDSSSARLMARRVRRNGGRTILPTVTWAGDRRRWLLKECIKGFVARRLFDAVAAAGERAKAYFMGLGFTEDTIWKVANVVDNDHFARGAARARANAPGLRNQLGLPLKYFLFVGALEPWKNVTFLLDCYADYRRAAGQWSLVLVGVGSVEESLRAKVQSEQIPDVVFAGMKSHEETPAYYALASCLVLPSLSEPWGLVINEAEAAGLPVLASNRCGSVPELVHRGINGYIFEPTDREELVRLLRLMSDGSVDLERMGHSSRQLIQYFTPEHWADALADCVHHLLVGSSLDRRRRLFS